MRMLMRDAVSIITPAYHAEAHIGRAVKSAIAQSFSDWEMLIVADDGADYARVLGADGIVDERLVFLSTGTIGAGSSAARNVALEAAQHRYGAILDADDYWTPQKLERALSVISKSGIVSSALQIVDAHLNPLRTIGVGDDVLLDAGAYKFTNISMDSMLVYDRKICDARYDPSFPHLTDIDFLLKLFAKSAGCYHLGAPLHAYVKEPQSMSNVPGASERLGATKRRLMHLLQEGHYPLADPNGRAGLIEFYRLSLKAEQSFLPVFEKDQTVLFEDHLEQFLPSEKIG